MESRRDLVFYFAYLVERETDRGVTLRDLAERWGVTHVSLVNIRKHLRGGAKSVEEGIAKAETAGSIDELRRRASKWRLKHPDWWPRGYMAPSKRNSDFSWWTTELSRQIPNYSREQAWALSVAGEEMAGREPREERRAAYVTRAIEALLDLPSADQAALRRRSAAPPPAGKNGRKDP